MSEERAEYTVYQNQTKMQPWQEAPAAGNGWRQQVAALAEKAQRPPQIYYLLFAAGALFGLVVLGWWLWPVQWVDGGFEHLTADRQAAIVEAAADLNSYGNNANVARIMHGWDSKAVACEQAIQTGDMAQRARLVSLVVKINGVGCNNGENK